MCGMWISVLEDEAVLNNLITKYLQKEGYSVRSYLRGEDAVQGLDKPTDLWVIDIMLPDIDGFTVFREVHAAGGRRGRASPEIAGVLCMAGCTGRAGGRP